MDQSVKIHPNLEKLFPPNNLPPSVAPDLELPQGDGRLSPMCAPAPTALASASSSPPSHNQNNNYGVMNNSCFNLPNLRGALPPFGPLLFPGAVLPGSVRHRMPSAMDFVASGFSQQPLMFPLGAQWAGPMVASMSYQMLLARNLAIAAANSSLFAQSQSAMNGGLTTQQLTSAMGFPQTSPSLIKADTLVCGPSNNNNRAEFELPFYADSSAMGRGDDFVRPVDDAATSTALSMLEDDRRCAASESSAAVRKLTTTSPSHSSPDNKNWKRRPAPLMTKKQTSSTSDWRSGARDVHRTPFELRCDHHHHHHQQQQHDRVIRPSTEHSPGPSGDSVVATRDSSRALSEVISVQSTDASGGGMLVSRRRDDGHLDVRVVYVREFVLQCSASPYASLPPPNLSTVVLEMNEIVAKFPGRFQPARYAKQRVSLLDRHLLHGRA